MKIKETYTDEELDKLVDFAYDWLILTTIILVFEGFIVRFFVC